MILYFSYELSLFWAKKKSPFYWTKEIRIRYGRNWGYISIGFFFFHEINDGYIIMYIQTEIFENKLQLFCV
jgi:hypothetical protein